MGEKSAIEWTRSDDGTAGATWNPVRGCSRVSEGCRHCYAESVANRSSAPGKPYHGLVTSDGRWNGTIRFVEEAIDLPLRWKAPRRIFVNSMSDLFHEKVEEEWLALIWGVMMLAEQHTFQILTKRPERMCDWLKTMKPAACVRLASNLTKALPYDKAGGKHIWLGVSVEDQATADERIPLLLQTPAAVRWVSYEPALGPVSFKRWLDVVPPGLPRVFPLAHTAGVATPLLDWLVVGGESGPGARPFDLAWARSAIAQCRAAGVPVFVKQLGARPCMDEALYHAMVERGPAPLLSHRSADPMVLDAKLVQLALRDRKGGDIQEWPADLRVREWPT